MKPRGGGNNCGKLTKPREPDRVLIDRHATSVCSPPERMGGDRLRRTMHPLIIRFPLPSPWGEKSRGGLSRVHVRISKVNSLYGYICVCVCVVDANVCLLGKSNSLRRSCHRRHERRPRIAAYRDFGAAYDRLSPHWWRVCAPTDEFTTVRVAIRYETASFPPRGMRHIPPYSYPRADDNARRTWPNEFATIRDKLMSRLERFPAGGEGRFCQLSGVSRRDTVNNLVVYIYIYIRCQENYLQSVFREIFARNVEPCIFNSTKSKDYVELHFSEGSDK